MPTIRITSVQNPRVKRLLKLRKPRERRAAGLLIAEGQREVTRALAAGLRVVELWVCPGLLGEDAGEAIRAFTSFSPRLEVEVESENVDVVEADEAVLRKVAYHREPEGVLGVFEAPAWSLDDLPPTTAEALYLVAVGSEKPGNLGAMVRTAAAAGCDAVLAVGPAVDVFNPNTIRNSTGAVFALPTVVVEDGERARRWLKQRGVTLAAALADAGAPCFEVELSRPLAVAIGPEHAGLDVAWSASADVALTIPMAGAGAGTAGQGEATSVATVDSLNASNAAAVLLFEAVRQHRLRTAPPQS